MIHKIDISGMGKDFFSGDLVIDLSMIVIITPISHHSGGEYYFNILLNLFNRYNKGIHSTNGDRLIEERDKLINAWEAYKNALFK